ncbi:MAG: glycoside hydrolase family 9 protein [Planctomycetota bacterium]|jgi:endoglucanase|nr:glycoside hydrolase family 9 protein [Planctomycetota bacterium]
MPRLISILLLVFAVPLGLWAAEDRKLTMARQAREMAIEAGLLEGICEIALIRPDLLEVTLDAGVVGLLDDNPDPAFAQALGGCAADLQKPEAFTITGPQGGAFALGVQPATVGRASSEWHNCLDSQGRWPLVVNKVYRHAFYLQLTTPLVMGQEYAIAVNRSEPDTRFAHSRTFRYDVETTSKALKINQLAYSSRASRRYAYLGWWAGNLGAVAFDDFTRFTLLDAASGAQVLDGAITLRGRDDVNSGEHIYQLDLSAAPPGQYRIVVPGLARSELVSIGGQAAFEVFYHTARAFFHQRCGQEMREPWTAFTREACHAEVYEDGQIAAGAIGHGARNNDGPVHAADAPSRSMRGGYHDAADFDTFTRHLRATAQMLAAYEMFPDAFIDGQLNLPESGNGIPDLLDEAEWSLMWYVENQYANGSVPLGRVNLSDARKQNFAGGKEAPMPPYGIIPPHDNSTPSFAAVAAQFARCLRAFDPAKADRYHAAAVKAWDYSSQHSAIEEWEAFVTDAHPLLHPDLHRDVIKPGRSDGPWHRCNAWAAGELLLSTGEARYNDYVVQHQAELDYWHGNGVRLWAYVRCPAEVVDPATQAKLRAVVVSSSPFSADSRLKSTEEAGYRMANGQGTACGWGRCQGVDHGDILVRAWYLTRDQRYLDAAMLNADWHCGANPLSQTYMTGMGNRFPDRPEISWFLYTSEADHDPRGPTVRGISIYGNGPPLRSYPGLPKVHPDGDVVWPLWRSWRDVWGNHAEIYSEFTVNQTIGPASLVYATLYALEQEAGTVAVDAKAQFPLGARDR